MPRTIARRIAAPVALLLALALAGCLEDPYNDRARATATAPAGDAADVAPPDAPADDAPPPGTPAVPRTPARSEREALRRFALAYANWTFDSLAATREALVHQATGPLRAALAREARDAADEASRRASTQRGTGTVVGILMEPGRPAYVIVRETAWFGDEAQQSGWFLYRARAVETADGWRVSTWQALN